MLLTSVLPAYSASVFTDRSRFRRSPLWRVWAKTDGFPDAQRSPVDYFPRHPQFLHREFSPRRAADDRFVRQATTTAPKLSSTPKKVASTEVRTPNPPEDAVVETRPDLIHPSFFTYFGLVTIPCVIAWIGVTWLCLWICRPHSPLYREILKRLIEHSQMKQKSVLFAATVLAGERKPPEEPTASTST